MQKAKGMVLADLIGQNMQEHKVSRSTLAREMGYRNVAKGLRKLDRYLCNLESPGDDFVVRLCSVLRIDASSFETAKQATEQALLAERQQAFQPSLVVDLAIEPRPWFAAQLISNHSRIKVSPELKSLPPAQEAAAILALFKAWLAASFLRDEAVGFRYYREYGFCQVFDRDGRLQEEVRKSVGMSPKRYLGNRFVDIMVPHAKPQQLGG